MSLKSLSIVAAATLALCGGAVKAQTAGLANEGFEDAANSAGEFANGWQQTSGNTTRTSAFAHSGTYSALLAIPDPGFGGTGLFQNSIDHGGFLAIDPANWGTAPTLTFWALGNASATGNVNYSLRYLNADGGILNPVVNTSFGAQINSSTWTEITRSGVVIPVNTAAVFLEMTLATGPTGINQCGVDNQTGLPVYCDLGQARVYIDDVNLTLAYPVAAAVPEPESYALMLAGLGVVGSIARRRRRSV